MCDSDRTMDAFSSVLALAIGAPFDVESSISPASAPVPSIVR